MRQMDDSELLAASAGGDAAAFATFYRRHLSVVVAFCRNATGSADTAADLTAEVFAAALSGAARYRPEHDSAAAWLRGIARNKLLDSRRRGRVEDATRRKLGMASLVIEDEDLRRVEELAAIGQSARVLSAVQRLPADERTAVEARIVEERDYAEIAAQLQCSESVVRQRVSRGLARLRTRLGSSAAEDGGRQ
jgi:RNA polymerase sigma factor (sigma-70 family)